MSEEGVERKLTAILVADVVGYSRLMGEDEAGTLARLKSLRKELVQPKIAGGRGRIVKLMGDGLLAEFPSVVEAVRCAVDIQQDMVGREADLPDERRLRLRIGVNLGDIIIEGSDIYGDGVNVAARLEGLAEPGGICISGKVYEEVRNKLPTAFEDLGEQEVKNIREPVRVYRWTDAAVDPMPGKAGAEGALALPDKPSIAVLPFDNMSGDPEQEYFADGITEDIITALSKFRWFFVIARNSTFVYKGQAVDVLAADAAVLRDALRRDELRFGLVPGPRLCFVVTRAVDHVGPQGDAAHRLDATGDADVDRVGLDQPRDHVVGLLAGAALRVYGRGSDAVRQACAQPGVACDVQALLAGLRDAAADNLFDHRGLHACALDHLGLGLG